MALVALGAHAQRLIELAGAVRTGVRRMDQQVNLAAAESGLDLLAAHHQIAGLGLKAEPVKRRLAQGAFDPIAKIRWDLDSTRLERPRECGLQLPFRLRRLQRRPIHPDPCASARGSGAHIRSDGSVWTQSQTDERRARSGLPRQDARAFRDVIRAGGRGTALA